MLKERVTVNRNGFQVSKDSEEPERSAYYATFSLADEKVEKLQANPVTYWNALNASAQMVNNRTFICVWEVKGQEVVEEYSFYFTTETVRPQMRWRIEKNKKYGDAAYVITLEWMGPQWDKIHKSHIWLKHKRSKRKFSFLKDVIEPMDLNKTPLMDQYVINLPMDVRPEELVIECDELLQKKYLLTN